MPKKPKYRRKKPTTAGAQQRNVSRRTHNNTKRTNAVPEEDLLTQVDEYFNIENASYPVIANDVQ